MSVLGKAVLGVWGSGFAKTYVACQAHPVLVKIGLDIVSLLVCIRLVKAKGLTARVSSRPGAKAAFRRPRPTGTRQYLGMKTNRVVLTP